MKLCIRFNKKGVRYIAQIAYINITDLIFCPMFNNTDGFTLRWDEITQLEIYPDQQFFFPFEEAVIKEIQQYCKNVKVYTHGNN